VNYGAERGSALLAVAEATHKCSFTLRGQLILKECLEAGKYSRAKEMADSRPRRPSATSMVTTRDTSATLGPQAVV